MTLNLYDILQEVVIGQDVVNAIDNKEQVIINYSDEKNRAPEKRLIEPYAYGLTKAGNEVLRAYQYEGDTYRGIPKWKYFRLDRIESWTPTGNHFNVEPNKHGWPAERYNTMGDDSMAQVFKQVSFDDDVDADDKLGLLRKKTERLKQSTPVNISNMYHTPSQGAIDPPSLSPQPTQNVSPTPNPYKGAIDVQDTKKGDDYWAAFDAAEKEMNKQNYKDKYNTKRREDRWQHSADTRRFWRKGALNDWEDEDEDNENEI